MLGSGEEASGSDGVSGGDGGTVIAGIPFASPLTPLASLVTVSGAVSGDVTW